MLFVINNKKNLIGDRAIIGVTASNWKGVVSENSSITPQVALMRATAVSSRLDIDVLMKVDEPGLFKELQLIISNNLHVSNDATILAHTMLNVSERDETIIAETVLETSLNDSLSLLKDFNYDTRITVVDSNAKLKHTPKPPRGPTKISNKLNLAVDENHFARIENVHVIERPVELGTSIQFSTIGETSNNSVSSNNNTNAPHSTSLPALALPQVVTGQKDKKKDQKTKRKACLIQ